MINNNKELVEKLRKEAQVNKAFNAVCHIFALRQRARKEIYINSLMQKMEKEGFRFEKADYVKVLQFLASLGIGKLYTDHKGRVMGLKEIHTTLQSIGSSACADGSLKGFKFRNKFKPIASPVTSYIASNIKLQMPVGSRHVTVDIPKEMTSEEIALLIEALKDKKTP